ncbi:hypothetical protein [Nocardia nepalensis]|uniref:hypothetical protein n=1 Tax=Nocardia nepalensis TaxID=3375448 RepID=UPI003B6842DB
MNLILSEVPDWMSVPRNPHQLSARDEFHTPFGVYALLTELTARYREITGSSGLCLAYQPSPRSGHRLRTANPDFRLPRWARHHNLLADEPDTDEQPVPLQLRMGLLRLTYLELHQNPVANIETTLVNDSLSPNRGNLAEYRQVVANASQTRTPACRRNRSW